jgi:hypothetical protein
MGSAIYRQGVAPALPLRKSSNTGFFNRTGTPNPNTVIEVYDPTSSTAAVTLPYASNTDPHYTAQIGVTGIAGPDSNVGAPAQWGMVAAAGTPAGATYETAPNYQTSVLKGPLSQPTPTPWTLLSPPMSPPQPCTGGACDTDQATIPSAVYGTNPDQYTPYVNLDTTLGTHWAMVTGTVWDTATTPICPGDCLPGIPVSITDPANHFPPFEKVTDVNGKFAILVPAPGNMTFRINSPTAVGSVPSTAHYYNPHYATLPPRTANVNPATPGQSFDLAALSGLPLQLQAVAPPNPASVNLGTITGQVNSLESPGGGLNGVTLELRDIHGYVLLTTTSAATGSFIFSQIPTGSYLVTPVTELRESANPTKSGVLNLPAGGTVSAGTFQIRGVPAVVIASSTIGGTIVAVYLNGTTIGTVPPMLQPSLSLPVYTTVIPGGPPGAIYTSPAIAVPPGKIYNFDCWKPNPPAPSYTQGTAGSVNGGVAVNPNTTYTVVCP